VSAILSGGVNPTGSITFTVYIDSTLFDTYTVPVIGDGSYDITPFTPFGTFQWDVSYSGDEYNAPASDNNDPSGSGSVC
jgi:hypothetical protein